MHDRLKHPSQSPDMDRVVVYPSFLQAFRSLIPPGITEDEQLPATNLEQISTWLSTIVHNVYPENIVATWRSRASENPLDVLLGEFRQYADRQDCLRLAQATGYIFEKHFASITATETIDQDTMDTLGTILTIFQAVPAPENISLHLFEMYKQGVVNGKTSDESNIRRELLLALAASPPPLPEEDIIHFFKSEMHTVDFAAQAFNGLTRFSLTSGIEALPEYMSIVKQRNIPLSDDVIWSLVRQITLEDPPTVIQLKNVLLAHPDIQDRFLQELRELNTPEKYPEFWQHLIT